MIFVVRNRVGDRRQRADTPSEVGSSALLARPHPHAVHRRSTSGMDEGDVAAHQGDACCVRWGRCSSIVPHTNPMMWEVKSSHTHVAEPPSPLRRLMQRHHQCKSYPRGSFSF